MTLDETLAAAWLVLVAILVFVMVFVQIGDALPVPIAPIVEDGAFTACVQMAQERLKITHRHVQGYEVIQTANIPRRGVYFSVTYQADGNSYQCFIARGINKRWFLNSLYIK